MPIILAINFPDLKLTARGKVRDIYDLRINGVRLDSRGNQRCQA